MSSHASRYLIAAIAAPIILSVLFLAPPVALFILVALVGLWGWYEYYSACLEPGRPVLLVVSCLGWLFISSGAYFLGAPGLAAGVVAAMMTGALYFLFNYTKIEAIIDQLGRFALGHLYLSLFLAFIILMFALEKGPQWVLFSLLVTMLGDTFAFYAGRTFGRRPLYPAVSPKKTWEGLAGGILAAGFFASILSWLLLPAIWYEAGLLGLFLGVWGATGDLFESMLKRSAGVKDSGSLLMGHGGIWDRLDAILFNVPVIYFFALFRCGG